MRWPWLQQGVHVPARSEPPTGIDGGRLSNAPLLGNGDLGISVGGSLPGKSQPKPPPGGQFVVSAALCNASDPRQLWAGKVLTSPGTVSSITNATPCTRMFVCFRNPATGNTDVVATMSGQNRDAVEKQWRRAYNVRTFNPELCGGH